MCCIVGPVFAGLYWVGQDQSYTIGQMFMISLVVVSGCPATDCGLGLGIPSIVEELRVPRQGPLLPSDERHAKNRKLVPFRLCSFMPSEGNRESPLQFKESVS